MKTTAKKLTTYGNLGLVQLRLEPETDFFFRPGGPEIKSGGLIISESTGEGVVGKLITINNTEAYLLLTDADVLVGAKQNRVMNKSMLLAPLSKTVIDVSCIERLRWQYTSQSFSNPGTVADPDLRKEKARTLSFGKNGPEDQKYETQRAVWSHIHESINEQGCASRTESYSDLINYRMEREGNTFPACEPESGCNGFAVILDRKIISVDLFGREDVFSHYFPMLRDSAFRIASKGKKDKHLDQHEAYYRVLEAIDESEAATSIADTTYSGAGSYNTIETEGFVGSILTFNGELIHNALFAKQS
jgi:hypothetical protein